MQSLPVNRVRVGRQQLSAGRAVCRRSPGRLVKCQAVFLIVYGWAMAFQSLYRRYRPRRFDEVQGQDHVVRALRNAVRGDTVAHAYLFSGPRGTGKTSTARILAKAINCEAAVDGEPCCECPSCRSIEAGNSLDVSELDAASNNGVEAMRDLVGRVAMGGSGRSRLYILDEVHMLSAAASNALLKTLEEPPPHVIFVLATTDPQKVLPTIRSRTQHYEFRLIGADVLQRHLRQVAGHAGLEVTDEAIERAVEQGHGSARDALSALDQIVAAGGAVERDGSIDDLAEALCERDTGRALTAVAGACQAGRDPRHLGEALLAHLRDAFLSVLAPEVVSLPDEARELVSDQGRRLGPAAAVRAMDALGEALQAMREAPDPRIPLEIALVRLTRPELDNSPGALVERIERLERMGRQGSHPSSEAPAGPEGRGPSPVPPQITGRSSAAASAPETPAPASPAAPESSSAARAALGGIGRRPPVAPGVADPVVAARREESAAPAGEGPATASATLPESAGGGLPSREELTLAWADHVLSGLRPRAKGLFGAGRFTAVEHDAAVFSLPSEALRTKAEPMLPDLEAALGAHFARRVPVRLVVDNATTPQRMPETGMDQEHAVPGRRTTSAPRGPEPDDDVVDLGDLRDAPPDERTGLDRLTQAFPGTEIISGDPSGGS